jgi:hypothetical protein
MFKTPFNEILNEDCIAGMSELPEKGYWKIEILA